MQIGKKLKPSTVVGFFIRAAISTMLLVSCTSIAAGQQAQEKQRGEGAELAKQADARFQEAVLLSDPKDRELRRARLMEARQLWLRIGDPEKAARACLQIGDCCKRDNAYQEALTYYHLALETKSARNAAGAIALIAIAQIYADIYEDDLAITSYERAVSQARAAKDASSQALAWSGLAHLYHRLKESDRAMDCITQARQLYRPPSDENTEAELLRLAGILYQEKGRTGQAREAYEEALKLCRKLEDEAGLIRTLCLLSDLYLVAEQQQMALETSDQAVELAERRGGQAQTMPDIIRARDLRWRASLSQARARRAVGQKELAVKSYRWAIHHLEGLYWTFYITTETSAAAFRQACQVPYVELADLLVELGEIEQAYSCAQQAKARAMMGVIEARRTADWPKNPAQEEASRETARAIARLRARLAFSTLTPPQQDKIQKEIEDLEYRLREMRLRFELERPQRQVIWSSRPTLQQLQEQLGRENFTILDFLIGPQRTFAWLISANKISLGVLPGRSDIEKNVGPFLAMIGSAPNPLYLERDIVSLKERARSLHSILLGPLSEQIVPGQKLVVVPDGLLHYLPFEALVHNDRYMIEDHEISYVPSVNLLMAKPNAKSPADSEAKMELLAVGDPVFGPAPQKPHLKKRAARPVPLAQRMRLARGFQLDALPRTRDEIQYIASLFPADKRQVYLGEASTERALKREVWRRYRRIHLATHALIDERSASRSAIVLSLNNDPEEDGFLDLDEVAALDLDCDLVVLSACQTGRGQMLVGEGIIGLSRAFFYAGARSMVVSLWSVSDVSTSMLMKGFYQQLADNAKNIEALRAAKLSMLESSLGSRHPYYWAPFILIGKP